LKDNVPYEYFDEETFSHKLRLGENLVLPISFERRIFRELVKIEERLSRDEALEICTN
jgi:hypothetical protein